MHVFEKFDLNIRNGADIFIYELLLYYLTIRRGSQQSFFFHQCE